MMIQTVLFVSKHNNNDNDNIITQIAVNYSTQTVWNDSRAGGK